MVRSTSRNRAAGRNAAQTEERPARTTSEPARSASTQASPATSQTTASSAESAPATTLPATQSQQRSLAPVNERNAFEAYGQQTAASTIVGTLMKFNKGDWITGDDEDVEEELLEGVVVNMDEALVGWIRWQDQRPAEQLMGTIASGFQPGPRSALGWTDQSQWERDQEGRPRDPWQMSNQLLFKVPGEPASEANLYTFATSSKGGIGAIGKLCMAYGREMRARPNDYPIIKLGSDSYRHPEYGRTYVPMFEIVGWEPKDQFVRVAAGEQSEAAE